MDVVSARAHPGCHDYAPALRCRLHSSAKQFDWLSAHAAEFDPVIIGGDLLDLASVLDLDTQIVVVEKYLNRIRQQTRLLVCSGNHDGDSRNAADESVAYWL